MQLIGKNMNKLSFTSYHSVPVLIARC